MTTLNTAAVRKALEDTLFLAKKYVAQSPATSAVIFENGKPAREIDYLQAVKNAEAALAAPPRNCDRFATAYEAIKAWDGGLDTAEDIVRMITWLLGKAEGGAE